MIKKLIEIQSALKAPKGQKNTFGNYSYRSAEDILNAVKPLLSQHELAILIADEIVMIGERIYVKATARLLDADNNSLTTTAYARETLTKKGMDESQITGSASSYARKYALNGMFAIDDTKDADTMDNKTTHRKQATKPKNKYTKAPAPIKSVSNLQWQVIKEYQTQFNLNDKQLDSLCKRELKYSVEMLDYTGADVLIKFFKAQEKLQSAEQGRSNA